MRCSKALEYPLLFNIVMATTGTNFVNILSWHKKSDSHPLFSVEYARENLASLAETLVMLASYLVLGVLVLHFAYTIGLLETETLLWLFVQNWTRALYFGLPPSVLGNPYWAAGFILVTFMMVFVLHLAFDVLKANLHPNFKKEFAAIKIIPKVRIKKPVKPLVIKKLKQFRKFMTIQENVDRKPLV